MDYVIAKKELLKGNKIKLPEWSAYLFYKDNEIHVHIDFIGGEEREFKYSELNSNFKERNSKREDWEVFSK